MGFKTWSKFLSTLGNLSKTAFAVSLILPAFWIAGCGGSATPVAVQLSPGNANLTVGQSQAFSATVLNTTNTGISWSIQEGSAGGTVSPSGVYTAPLKAGTYHVAATSVADPTKSASAAITATAPAPAFSSTAPAAASEGVVYTYTLTATDPVSTAITYAVKSGPSGASVNGSSLSWTPTHAQSRVANDFDITATTAAGGTADQKFTV